MAENKTSEKKVGKQTGLHIFILIVILLFSSIPLLRGYMGDTGESLLWCLRLSKIVPTRLVEPTCILGILIVRTGIVLSSYLFFYIFNKRCKGNWIDTITGVIFFVFGPYQLYIAFDKTDITDMILWVCILLFATGILMIIDTIQKKKTGLTILYIILDILALSGMTVSYLLSHISESALSFEGKGYVFGEMFTSFFYSDDHPGYGIALFFAVCLWIYYKLISVRIEEGEINEIDKKRDILSIVFAGIGILFMLLSSINFPWDSIVRDVPLAGKVILRLESPVIFFGISSFCFCIPAMRGLSYARQSKNEFVSKVMPVLVLFFAVAVGMFLMSEYMYWQYPLGFANM